MPRKTAPAPSTPPRPMRQVRFIAPALWPDDAALLEFLETAMQVLGNWPFTIVESREYTDPETGREMLEALLEVPPYPEPAARGHCHEP